MNVMQMHMQKYDYLFRHHQLTEYYLGILIETWGMWICPTMLDWTLFRAPCGLRGCKNRPAPFPGWMSYKATKPGSDCPVF